MSEIKIPISCRVFKLTLLSLSPIIAILLYFRADESVFYSVIFMMSVVAWALSWGICIPIYLIENSPIKFRCKCD